MRGSSTAPALLLSRWDTVPTGRIDIGKEADSMSSAPKRAKPRKSSALGRTLKGLYIVLFALSLVVVVAYAALNVFAPAPTVESQVTFPVVPTDPIQSAGPGDGAQTSAEPAPTPTPLVLNRREGVYT